MLYASVAVGLLILLIIVVFATLMLVNKTRTGASDQLLTHQSVTITKG